MGVSNVVTLFGGVALFLFGMGLMGDSLKLVAGQRLELILYRLSNTALKGVLLGTFVTAAIQSSSATSAMVVGFVNSGMMKLTQAIGVVLGANVGTSVTGWILCLSYVSANPSSALSLLSSDVIAAVMALAGILLRMLSHDVQKRHAGDILLGFAVLMYGMQVMSGSVSPLRESESFLRLMTMFEHPVLGILIGALVTAVLQSNSASVGILQALSVTGTISFATAFPMIMGMGIGAAVPVLLSAVGANRDGKRTALIYLFTGVFGTVIFSALFYSANRWILPFPYYNTAMGPVEIALINSVFRICSILILFPFLRQLEAFTGRLVPEKAVKQNENKYILPLERLEERFIVHPALAIEQSRSAINAMAKLSEENLAEALILLDSFSQSGCQVVADMEDAVDIYEDRLGTYLMKLCARELTGRQNEDVSKFLHTLSDFERISDHAMNVAECAKEISDKEIIFSSSAKHELEVLRSAVTEIVSLAVSAFTENDFALARQVEPLEDVIDGLCDKMKDHHIARLQTGDCTLSQGFVFNDLLTNYERIADHCSNIAVAMIELEEDSFDTHEYLHGVKDAKSSQYMERSMEFAKKYAI